MKFDAKITGVDDIDKAIERLNSRQARNALSRATNQALQPALTEARRLANEQFDGPSRESVMGIKKRVLKKGERDALGLDQAAIVYFAPQGWKLRFWEEGFVRYGRHYAAKPMIRPALDTQQAAIIARYGERAGTIITREAAKRAKR